MNFVGVPKSIPFANCSPFRPLSQTGLPRHTVSPTVSDNAVRVPAVPSEAAEAVCFRVRHRYSTSDRRFCSVSKGILIYGQRMEFAKLPSLTFPPVQSILGYSYEAIPIRTTCPCNPICHFYRRMPKRQAGPTFRSAWQSTVCQSKHARAPSWFRTSCRRTIGPPEFWTRPKPAIFKWSFKSSRRRSCQCRCASSWVLKRYHSIRARLCGLINRSLDHFAATI